MAKSYTKYIGYGGTATLIGLITWFFLYSHFLVEYEGDKECAGTFLDPCEWHYNLTLKDIPAYYIYNKNAVELTFEPKVLMYVHCKKDNRFTAEWRNDRSVYLCGSGWRDFDWTKPLTEQYAYVEKFTRNDKHEYKIVVLKHNPNDVVKFAGQLTKEEIDPFLLPVIKILQDCTTTTKGITQIVRDKYIFYYNKTFCSDEPINLSCTQIFDKNRILEEVSSYVDYQNTTICKDTGLLIGNNIIDYSKADGECSRDGCIIECDYFQGGNKNGKCESGENCYKYNICNKVILSQRKDTPSLRQIEIE